MKKRIQELHKRISSIKDSQEEYLASVEGKISVEERNLLNKILSNEICCDAVSEEALDLPIKKIKLAVPNSRPEEYYRELFKKFLLKLSKNHILVEEKLFLEMKALLSEPEVEPNLLTSLYEASAWKFFENWETSYYSQCNDRKVLRFVEKYREQINDIVSNNESKWLKEDIEYQESSSPRKIVPPHDFSSMLECHPAAKDSSHEQFFMTPPPNRFMGDQTAEKILSPIDLNTNQKSIKRSLFPSTPLDSLKKGCFKENERFESPSNLLNLFSPEKKPQPNKLSRFLLH